MSLANSFLVYEKTYGKKAASRLTEAIDRSGLPNQVVIDYLDSGKPPEEILELLAQEAKVEGDSIFDAGASV